MSQPRQPVLVKRYAGRRFYCPASGTYLGRDDLITMANNRETFVVIDADTGNDITYRYHPIIVER
jgi:polyhydroxyalkanoate synthesis regulator protein